jgi:NADPH2:quinone reductase
MKVIQFREPGPPSVLECVDAPMPRPGPGEVLVRARAIGVGVPDTLIRAGDYRWMPPLPAIPGTELAGEIEQVGAGVTALHVGQRVYATARERPQRGGHYVEYITAPAECVFPLPDAVSFESAACLANYQVAFHLLRDAARVRSGQTLLLYGAAGGVGNAIIDLARHWDLRVIGVAGSTGKARAARELGATHVIDRSAEDVSERVRSLTHGRGVDIIADPVGGPTVVRNIGLLAPLGTLVVFGSLGGHNHDDVLAAMQTAPSSPAIRTFSIHAWDQLVQERRAGMRELISLMAQGTFRPRIFARLPLADARRAHELIEAGAVSGKLLLAP